MRSAPPDVNIFIEKHVSFVIRLNMFRPSVNTTLGALGNESDCNLLQTFQGLAKIFKDLFSSRIHIMLQFCIFYILRPTNRYLQMLIIITKRKYKRYCSVPQKARLLRYFELESLNFSGLKTSAFQHFYWVFRSFLLDLYYVFSYPFNLLVSKWRYFAVVSSI